MLGTLVLYRVRGKIHGTDNVAKDNGSTRERTIQLKKEVSKPRSFSNYIGYPPILGFGTRTGHNMLSFRGPGDEIVAKKYTKPRGGPTCRRTPSPISIRI